MDIDLEYVTLQQKYRKMNHNKKNIFPYEWYFIKEYQLKKDILQECIKENILINESMYYYDFRKKALNGDLYD